MISLILISKILEELLERLLNTIEVTKILLNPQFDFRSNHSTIYQMHHLVNKTPTY